MHLHLEEKFLKLTCLELKWSPPVTNLFFPPPFSIMYISSVSYLVAHAKSFRVFFDFFFFFLLCNIQYNFLANSVIVFIKCISVLTTSQHLYLHHLSQVLIVSYLDYRNGFAFASFSSLSRQPFKSIQLLNGPYLITPPPTPEPILSISFWLHLSLLCSNSVVSCCSQNELVHVPSFCAVSTWKTHFQLLHGLFYHLFMQIFSSQS